MHSIKDGLPYSQTDFLYYTPKTFHLQTYCKKSIWPLSFITVFVFLSILFVQAQQAKYVFYFIGDGMGVNQVLGTEMYRGELEGKIGVTPLLFTQFPYATIATTFSATNGVTDSAAAGTALATGNKTKNGALGVKKDLETKVNSVASWAKNNSVW